MGLFHHSSSSSNNTCPSHSLAEDAEKALFGDTSFYKFNVILSGACAAFVILVMIVHKQFHATHLSVPSEQVKIMKIGTLITMFSLISFLSVCFPSAEVYIRPWVELVEALALGSFFLLLCEYISPNHEQRYVFFAAKRVDGVKWFKTRWFMIFQFPIVALVVAVATDVTQAAGVYCEWSSKPHFAKFWLNLLKSASLVLSVLSIFRFYGELKTDLAHHRPLRKLFAFKAVVSLTFLQGIIFWILTDTGALKPTNRLTFADINIGLPNLLSCIEMVPLSLFFVWAYPWSVYKHSSRNLSGVEGDEITKFPQSYQGGLLGIRAWVEMVNPTETLKAIVFGLRLLGDRKQPTNASDGYQRTSREPLYDTAYQGQTDTHESGGPYGREYN